MFLMGKVTRISFTVDEDILKELDLLLNEIGAPSRSLLIGRAIREYVNSRKLLSGTGHIIGVVTVLYYHEEHQTVQLLNEIQHDYSNIIRSMLHIHIDKERCLEVIVVDGELEKVKEFYLEIEGLKGVKMIKPIFFKVLK